MKFRTWIVAATAGAIGYVAGTAAGRARFEQIKSRAREVAADPRVQQNISNLAGNVAKSAEKMNSPVSGMIKNAATSVQSSLHPEQSPPTAPPAPSLSATTPPPTMSTPPTSGLGGV